MGSTLALSLLVIVIKFNVSFASKTNPYNLEYAWAQIEYAFRSEQERQETIQNGTFKEGGIQPIDVEVYHDNGQRKVFITTPRIYDGVPATLGVVLNKHRNGNPIIAPYPNWGWHTEPKLCKKQRIVSVYRVFVDECDRLWIIDNGIIGNDQACPPQILAFNLKTNLLLRQYEVPFDQHLNTSLYLTPVADVKSNPKNCEDTFVYIADCIGFSLLVYSFKDNKSWRVIDKTFYPDPAYGTYSIEGKIFEVMDGILGLALSPSRPGHKRKLYFHAMSSVTENWVYTETLKNETLVSTALGAPKEFHTEPKRRKTQSAAEAMDSKGTLYFGLLGFTEIAAWNITEPYDSCHIHKIGCDMLFPTGMKVISDENGEESLWIMNSAFERYATGSLFPNQTNFRVLSAKIKDLQQLLGDLEENTCFCTCQRD